MKRSPIRRKPKPDPIAPEVRDQLRIRAGGLCEVRVSDRCKVWATEAHHRKLRRHGDHSLENLLLLCRPCHRWIHNHPKLSYVSGWMVGAVWNPAEIPWSRAS